ncbi:HAMP domain-containing sensor histidine kinase [Fluviicola sp.]|uniref:sensor histidine kinase n=1 Tax=Fluviicola sp. TaxID=1917219 RepID=UPI0026095FC9|nr:HAMP domain-containing sensor histidine kinase [Fluviicola sp.]
MSKLLDKPFKSFSIYALIILVCSIPVYYFVVDAIWLEELDEHNSIIRKRMEKGIQSTHINEQELNQTLAIWNSLQPGTKLIGIDEKNIKKDSVYTISAYNRFEKETDRFRVLSTTIRVQGKPYQLTISTNVEEADETLIAIAIVTILFFAFLVLGFVFLNKRISRKSWKPFYHTLNQLKNFDLNKDQQIHLEQSDIEEFEELNRELSELIRKNASAFNQQKRFIENASHELQTPLAILKSKMDVLLQDEHLSEDQSSTIEAINSNLSRISRINKNLLLLAKIENHQFAEEATVNIRDILEESIDLLGDYIQNKDMRIQLRTISYSVKCNQTLLEVLINNLLINAIRHGNVHDVIEINLGNNTLTFSNSGSSALNPDQLFVRFGISTEETTNSGLGLAISKEICERYNWKLSYAFNGQRHEFVIEF